jgi:hypothetical protein
VRSEQSVPLAQRAARLYSAESKLRIFRSDGPSTLPAPRMLRMTKSSLSQGPFVLGRRHLDQSSRDEPARSFDKRRPLSYSVALNDRQCGQGRCTLGCEKALNARHSPALRNRAFRFESAHSSPDQQIERAIAPAVGLSHSSCIATRSALGATSPITRWSVTWGGVTRAAQSLQRNHPTRVLRHSFGRPTIGAASQGAAGAHVPRRNRPLADHNEGTTGPPMPRSKKKDRKTEAKVLADAREGAAVAKLTNTATRNGRREASEPMRRKEYDSLLKPLHVGLLKLQLWPSMPDCAWS